MNDKVWLLPVIGRKLVNTYIKRGVVSHEVGHVTEEGAIGFVFTFFHHLRVH